MTMHVVIAARGLPGGDTPTHGIFEWQQARALARSGLQVSYASLDIRWLHRTRDWGVRHRSCDGVDVFDLNWPLGKVPARVQTAALRAAWRGAWQEISSDLGPIDVVHAHFAPWGNAVATSSLREHYAVVITEHWTKLNTTEEPPAGLLRMARHAYRAADVVLAVSEPQAQVLRRRTGCEVQVLPNMIQVDDFAPAAAVRGERRRGRQLITIGHLRPEKRHRQLVELVAQMGDVSLEIIGNGPERLAVQHTIDRLGVADRVRLIGHLERPDIVRHLAAADVFVLPSRVETFGVVVIEALAAGLPVVCTRSGGPETLVSQDTGLVVDDIGPEFEASIRTALDQDWRVSQLTDAAARFRPETIAAELTEVYQLAATRHSRGQLPL